MILLDIEEYCYLQGKVINFNDFFILRSKSTLEQSHIDTLNSNPSIGDYFMKYREKVMALLYSFCT